MSPPTINVSDIIVDCSEPESLAEFWSAILNRPTSTRTGPYVWLERVTEYDVGVAFQHVDGLQAKETKNRVHFDICTDDIPTLAARVKALGGRRLPGYEDGGFLVMADPEGNEFCVVSVAPVNVDDEGRTRYLEGLELDH